MRSFDRLKLVAAISVRSLESHKSKNLVIGGILFVGTFLVVFGGALLGNVERTMTQSITSSISGHLQAYSKTARDPLALFPGGGLGSQADFGHLPDFAPLKAEILKNDNVASAVPMGLDSAFISGGNEVDRILESFRAAVGQRDERAMRKHQGQIEEVARLLLAELDHQAELTGVSDAHQDQRADLNRVLSPEFWAELYREPELSLQFLDTHVAPLLDEGRSVPIQYIGTDLDAFAENYDRFEIVDGQKVPAGHRGFLLNKRFSEEVLKHKVARDLDGLHKEIVERGQKIGGNPLLEGRVKKLSRLYRRVALQLDSEELAALTPLLEREVPLAKGQSISRLLEAFLAVDDESFIRRYALFYSEIAPRIELYDVKVGDTITVKSFTRGGSLSSVNVKVYGTFRFKGLDRSDVAGGHNLMDLMSFRDLYDLMTAQQSAEIEGLRRRLTEVKSSADAENAFFGDDSALEAEVAEAKTYDEFSGLAPAKQRERRTKLEEESYDRATIEQGVVLNIAILLKDPSKIAKTKAELNTALAPLGAQVITWQEAAGTVGQFLNLLRVVLLVAAGIIFFVGMVIINNSMLMATMERVNEIGTLLAIGASEGFVLLMMLLETTVLGLVSGGLGGLAGALLILVLQIRGLPASNDVLVFLFSGPELFPTISAGDFGAGIVTILVVSILSSLYPAFVATRISPRAAMEAKE